MGTRLIVTQKGQCENMKVKFLKTKMGDVKILPNTKFFVYKLDYAWPPNQTHINTNTTPFDLVALFSVYLTSKFRYFKIQILQNSILSVKCTNTKIYPNLSFLLPLTFFSFLVQKRETNMHLIDISEID